MYAKASFPRCFFFGNRFGLRRISTLSFEICMGCVLMFDNFCLGFIPMMFCTASGFAGYVLNRPRLAFIVVTAMSQIYGVTLLVYTHPHSHAYTHTRTHTHTHTHRCVDTLAKEWAFIFLTHTHIHTGLLMLWHNEWAFIVLFVVFPVARQFVFSTFFRYV